MCFSTRAARVVESFGCEKWKMYAHCRPGVSAAKAACSISIASRTQAFTVFSSLVTSWTLVNRICRAACTFLVC